MPERHVNRLANTTSPYLLQHQHNPVDWYPWTEEAFAKAQSEQKPIFLSVGYSTCHWCHVMERESFESDSIAALLNKDFVSIKVDKEERPDVDRVYMMYLQATQGGGGWPMNLFLTPDLKPFVAGTYFPPREGMGRPSFAIVIRKVAEVWQTRRGEIEEQTADVIQQLESITQSKGGLQSLTGDMASLALSSCTEQLSERFDPAEGGFGRAPKFPRPCEINCLLAQHLVAARSGNKAEADEALKMATLTLHKMAAGGVYDHVGGGFHRYSVDEFWHVPHFEKMLYDNPQLVHTYLDAFALTGDLRFAWIARGVLDYLCRDLRDQNGGFFSAEDADSLNPQGEKSEGAFYLWTEAEVDAVLGKGSDASTLFKQHYYIKSAGNCDLSPRSDPHDEFKGLSCLLERKTVADSASALGLDTLAAEATLASAREKLHSHRAKRPRPHLDDKIVTAWNGMAIGAFARASRMLAAESPAIQRQFPVEGSQPREYSAVALQASDFVKNNLWDANTKRLRRSYRQGTASEVLAFADDYAHMIAGLLDLHSVTGDISHLQWAVQLQEAMDESFWDGDGGGYYATAGQDPSILLRMKEEYDGAEPSATSIAVGNLLRLSALLSAEQGEGYRQKALEAAGACMERLHDTAMAMPQMCASLFPLTQGHWQQVIIAGSTGAPDTETLMDAAHSVYSPNKVVILVDTNDSASKEFWAQHNPQILEMADSQAPKATAQAFICQDFSCKAPTSDPAVVCATLKASKAATGAQLQPIDLSQLR
ncbi:hypothetical protein WJX73_009886 [Symbiochloris irregularis]|uniref:Spermatogenesis-associated protein 20-like TRX domain-containing protein n=1 Tax=Symbiochloris irregularis TaxID=706552 RepID=A0AAW1NVG4_9CHLO